MTNRTDNIAGGFAVCGALMTIAFLAVVNLISGTAYPWFIYPAYAVLWWPLSVIVPRRLGVKVFSLAGSLLTILFLSAVNFISAPRYPWVLFAALPILLWPVVVYAGRRVCRVSFAAPVCIATALYYAALNLTIAKGFPWSMFIIYALLWWPLSALLARSGHVFGLSIAGSAITAVLFYLLNLLTTPQEIWFIYPVFAILWWPLASFFYVYLKAD